MTGIKTFTGPRYLSAMRAGTRRPGMPTPFMIRIKLKDTVSVTAMAFREKGGPEKSVSDDRAIVSYMHIHNSFPKSELT